MQRQVNPGLFNLGFDPHPDGVLDDVEPHKSNREHKGDACQDTEHLGTQLGEAATVEQAHTVHAPQADCQHGEHTVHAVHWEGAHGVIDAHALHNLDAVKSDRTGDDADEQGRGRCDEGARRCDGDKTSQTANHRPRPNDRRSGR